METAGESTSLLMMAHGNDTSIDKEGREDTKPMIVAQVDDPSILTNFKVHSNQESPCRKRSVVLCDGSRNDNALESPNCVDGSISIASFSGFLDPRGRFANTNNSVHYHLRSGVCLSDGYSCHGCVERISPQGSDAKFDSYSIGSIPSWVYVFLNTRPTSSSAGTQTV